MAITGTKVRTIKVQERPLDVIVPEGTLRFAVTVGEVDIYGADIDELIRKASAEMSRQRIEHNIPVILSERRSVVEERNRGYFRATLRGRHASRAAYLFLIDGKKETIEHPHIVALGTEFSDDDLVELNRLLHFEREAANATQAFLVAHCPAHANRMLSAGELLTEAEAAAGIPR